MPYLSLNPATGKILRSFETWDAGRLSSALEGAGNAQAVWRRTSFEERAATMRRVSDVLRARQEEFATLITLEMGKPIREARAEVEKCTLACDYYALCSEHFLQDEPVESDAGKSYVAYPPLGIVLAIMPWNFPFWQAFRAAVPALMAGNAVLLKHASNVPQCALAIQQAFREGGLPESLFATVLVDAAQIPGIIADPRVQGVTFTGSEPVGRQVAALAGQHLKKSVLELGGSDAFVVLRDADLDSAAQAAIASRFQNAGQSCIAAKRFILAPEIADDFVVLLSERIAALNVGDPLLETTQIGPLARLDLRDEVHRQVGDSLAEGAQATLGCQALAGEGAFYQPSLLDHVTPQSRAYREELFGPVAAVIRARDEADALRIANDTRFGLGSSIWSRDVERAERLAGDIQAGCTFINGMVKSDPRLPFGGAKASGFGRELSYHGIREFVNAKTVWIK
ncbi:MAG: NAD-dependent succinate-semialdehyde dehydrogenase [Sulfuricella sp.]|nr:NAD-dependent succinate-semialdehyde dehydrogenase [Sulfuricella sp.]